ncbi:hypothetical protein ABB37_00208 [Leptomonas pyrrhocoris]|uniref:Uncharacterized protein n=1 Tax=Leptomonas pyrrhocoris TaxID=157538 RepID=A0A0N0E003_LEPPY|nr:hypothetical protein ABB37_00208 [Leptomonas pyrrhocoris]XP_015664331.1 hypothetical protein ABB37_00208 [Leptomonas pyrrhocoris]KPA85891.1 hypothetical protein ABB37_00208 [Leptomonas pyrrhocoris]KPA85892.1 hypothetical protein ABB37_00208 [Leptomonas pyrrhocoris]|eukprot:XP_015664330.1 hypothetical protein ABB37_00208 [Leptomonas pyrrhocoris]
MSATIKAARACASTLLFHSLRLHAFRGAVPHVLVVVDRVPCVQQKAVVEGYVQVLRTYQQQGAAYLRTRHDDVMDCTKTQTDDCAPAEHRSHEGELFIALRPNEKTPCGSAGFTTSAHPPLLDAPFGADTDADAAQAAPTPLSYSVMPFQSEDFLDVIKRLQCFFRHCGDGQRSAQTTSSTDDCAPPAATVEQPPWCEEKFAAEYEALCPLLGPLLSSSGEPLESDGAAAAHDAVSVHHERCSALYNGPLRELLGCILVQQNAFQNEMKRYRLRLSLFDLGIRVAEHCHLLIMSTEADRLAKEGRYREALEEDQVYSYARSCAFRPEQAQTLAKAISDAIDLHSWKRIAADAAEGAAASTDTTQPPPPPASFAEALHNEELRAIFNPGALHWGAPTTTTTTTTAAAEVTTDVEAALRQLIDGPGIPLSIVSRDPAKVLTFSGGMEDCLSNTGYYVAAYAPERNDVWRHRERFHLAMTEEAEAEVEAEEGCALDLAKAEPLSGAGASTAASSTVGVHGRMKKKEYLALLKAKGQKPNKRQHDSDEDEDGALGRSNAPAGSCISNSIGGTFPIGEAISESFDLSQLNGTCDVFAYPDVFKQVTMSRPAPFTMTIAKGVVTQISDGAPAEFLDLLSLVRQVEGDCYVRELGIGLNPYVGLAHVVSDVTTFERQWGIHLSLGQRHPLFVKQRVRCNADGSVATGVHVVGPVLKRKAGKYHIDVFIDAAQLKMNDVFSIDFTKGIAIP